MIQHVIFDVDGTIWNSTPIVARGWQKAVDETGYSKAHITDKVLQREFGQPMDVIAEHLFGDVTDLEKRQEILEKCCAYEHQLLRENEEDIAYPGMRACMEELSETYQLYIVSNCQCGYIELVMQKNHMEHLFRDFDCFGNTGTCKGETIRRVMERNQISPKEAVYIGDTKGDQEAAQTAGIPFVFAAYGFGCAEGADGEIHSFAELLPLLKALDAQQRTC